MGLLTDRRLGATADWMRQRTGRSIVASTRAAAQRVGRLERTLAFDLNVPRGIWLQGSGADTYITFDQRGWLQVLSPDDSLEIGKTPWGRKHALGLSTALAGCDCCVEDVTWQVTQDALQPLGITFEEPCTVILNIPCDPCDPGGPGGG